MANKSVKGRNIKLSGEVVPPDPSNGQTIVKLQIVLAPGSINPTVDLCNMKYNKKQAFIMTKDDGWNEDYTIGYAYLKGGIVAKDGKTYPGMRYTDGCGKVVNYKLTFALNTVNPRTGGDGYGFLTTWEQYRTMLASDFGLSNHTYQHSGYDKLYQLKKAEYDVYNNTGYRMRTMVIPTSDEGYANTAPNLGYLMVGSSFGTPARDDFEGANDAQGVYGVYWGGVLDVRTANFAKGLLFNRWYSGEGQPGDWNDIKRVINETYNNSADGTKNIAAHWFSHGFNDANSDTFEQWKTVIELIKTHPKNNDSSWIPDQQEFCEYYETKQMCVKKVQTAGNIMNVELDISAVSARNYLRDMSLLVKGGTIQDINVEGADSYGVSKIDGLINIYKRNPKVSNPIADILPAQIISVIREGNQVKITYDRAVSQNMYSNSRGNAYSVSSNTVVNITGSGVNWTLNCQNPVVTGATMSYRMQRGNATDDQGLKVCTYIDYPIS